MGETCRFDVFISYGRADSKVLATKLDQALIDQGLTVWFDQNDIPLAVDFQEQIRDGIEKCHNFIFIVDNFEQRLNGLFDSSNHHRDYIEFPVISLNIRKHFGLFS